MGTVNLKTASGGSVILSPANTASDVTITVPASNATMAVNGPAFSAYQSSAQSIPASIGTKVLFQTKEFDTATAYDATTSRFQPLVAGYYQITSSLFFNLGVTSLVTTIAIIKSGTAVKSSNTGTTNANGYFSPNITALIYLNGSTDYIEIYITQLSVASQSLSASSAGTFFQAAMVRSA